MLSILVSSPHLEDHVLAAGADGEQRPLELLAAVELTLNEARGRGRGGRRDPAHTAAAPEKRRVRRG